MRITFFEITGWEKTYLRSILKGHTVNFVPQPLDATTWRLARTSDAVSVFIYSTVNQAIIRHLPKLRLIATRSTGFDHIDVAACTKKKITVCNVPFYGGNTVAEHTFALILSLSRNIHKSYVRTLRNDFSIEGLEGFDLANRTIGVIGGGHIGLHVIKIAKGFGMNVLTYDVNQNPFLAEVLGFTYAPLEEVLKKSDIITLHIPYTKETHHLINRKTFKLFKKGSILINTARGALVETDALLEALDNKTLAAAGLDVIEGEELIKEEKQLLHDQTKTAALGELIKGHIILSKDNVVFTPHIAFYSQEALHRILETTALNIIAFTKNKLTNTVPPRKK